MKPGKIQAKPGLVVRRAGIAGKSIFCLGGGNPVYYFAGYFMFTWPSQMNTSQAMATLELAATPTAVLVQLIIPDTPTPPPSATPTATPAATETPTATATQALKATTPPSPPPPPSDTPTAVPTLRPAPRIIGPRDELVWKDGTIVFEFEPQRLGAGELYCLTTMRGFDRNQHRKLELPAHWRQRTHHRH
jgi:hypothetical protein